MAQTNHNILIESPGDWKDYEIIDSGDGMKLERFGDFILSRPEPKALWSKSLSDSEWRKMAHTVFHPGAGFGKAGKEDVGTWEMLKKMPDRWFIEYKGKDRRAEEWSAFRHGVSMARCIDGGQKTGDLLRGQKTGDLQMEQKTGDLQMGQNSSNLLRGQRAGDLQTGQNSSNLLRGQNLGGLYMKMRLGLTSFKHVGVFPEQASNWEWIYAHTQMLCNSLYVGSLKANEVGGRNFGSDVVSQASGHFGKKNGISEKPKILNLFAYTGGASLAAKCAGAEVTHVDSVKQVVNWAKENMTSSGLDNIRWIVDDALKFVKREIRRGNIYNGLILDPPAYGHGPDGERWKLDELLFEMLEECSKIVSKEHSFVVLNLYSNGYSALLADTLLKKAFGGGDPALLADTLLKKAFGGGDSASEQNKSGMNVSLKDGVGREYTCGELVLEDKFRKVIPLSVFARMFTK